MGLYIREIIKFFILFTCMTFVLSCRGGTILGTGVSLQERAIILEVHNKLRASVAMGQVPGQPGAENMREMVWDEELAAKAQQWANQCTFQHDPHRKIDRFTMGQNMAIIWSTAPLAEDDGDFPSRIQNWFNEVQKYAYGDSWTQKTGHYIQLVWGDTNLVGCGFTYYKDAVRYNKLYVCNYGPGGNVVGYMPYETGTPACDNHGMYPSTKYRGLCSASGKSSPSYSGGNQRNSINNYYKPSSVYNAYNGKTSYSTSYQQPQQRYQQTSQQQYQQPQQQWYQQPQQQQQQQSQPKYQHHYQFGSQYVSQQPQQQKSHTQQNTYFVSGFKTYFKPTGFSFRKSWSS